MSKKVLPTTVFLFTAIIISCGTVVSQEGESDKAKVSKLTDQADELRYREKPDYKEAARLYQKAAELGDAYAHCSLGFLYISGQGVGKDDEKAKRHFKVAAEQNYSDASLQLGKLKLGDGRTKEAIQLFDKALEIIGEAKVGSKRRSSIAEANRFIVANLVLKGALEQSESYVLVLISLEPFLSKQDRLLNAELYFHTGRGFSLRSNKKSREPAIRGDLLQATYYLENALRLFRKTLGGCLLYTSPSPRDRG